MNEPRESNVTDEMVHTFCHNFACPVLGSLDKIHGEVFVALTAALKDYTLIPNTLAEGMQVLVDAEYDE